MQAVYTSVVLVILCTSIVCAIELQSPKTTGRNSKDKVRQKPSQAQGKPFSTPCPDQSYCLNGGTCYILDPLKSQYCECKSGFQGKRCEEKTFNPPKAMNEPDPSHSTPCSNDDGYCLNGGTCYMLDALNKRYCKCTKDFKGERCKERNTDGIDPPEAMGGHDRPDKHSESCTGEDNWYCLNGATCYRLKTLNIRYCVCQKQFVGDRCEEKEYIPPYEIQEEKHWLLCPQEGYCLNGGYCLLVPALRARYCMCAKDFTGYRCIEKHTGIDSLASMDRPDKTLSIPCPDDTYCLNGGICRILEALGNGYCVCKRGFQGQRCEEKGFSQLQAMGDRDKTHSEPCPAADDGFCLNSGICRIINVLGGRYCVCKSGFQGQRCEEKGFYQPYGMNCGLSAKGPNGIVRGDEARPQLWWPLQILKSRKCDLWATLTKLTSFEEWMKNVKSRY